MKAAFSFFSNFKPSEMSDVLSVVRHNDVYLICPAASCGIIQAAAVGETTTGRRQHVFLLSQDGPFQPKKDFFLLRGQFRSNLLIVDSRLKPNSRLFPLSKSKSCNCENYTPFSFMQDFCRSEKKVGYFVRTFFRWLLTSSSNIQI